MAGSDDDTDFDTLSDENFLSKGFPSPGTIPQEEEPEEERPGGILEGRLKAPEGAFPKSENDPDDPEDVEDATEQDQAAGEKDESETPVPTKGSTDVGKVPEGEQPKEAGAKSDDAGAETPEGTDSGTDHTTPKQTASENTAATTGVPQTPEEIEAAYRKLMAPFKANGREFTPSSPEEVIRLMQMGVNYTKKMQALKPNLRLMRMLDNNGLLEEGKLSYLIDLERKDPKAIQKLLHESKVDPLDLDLAAEPAYQPGTYAPSESEMAFHEVVDNVASTTTGKETIAHINSTWDPDSKQALFKEPQLLQIIDNQWANGIYHQIHDEIERRRILGELTATPFIQAYKQVGDELHAQGKLKAAGTPTAGTPAAIPQNQAVDTRSRQRRQPVSNGDKAKAVTPGPKVASSTPREFDPFSMTDEQIMAMTSLKV